MLMYLLFYTQLPGLSSLVFLPGPHPVNTPSCHPVRNLSSIPDISRRPAPCLISKLLPCLFSQSCPLYDIQASILFVFVVFPPVRSPSLHPDPNNRCPRGILNACMSPPLQGYGAARTAVLAVHAHPSRYQPNRPLFDIAVTVATGIQSVWRGRIPVATSFEGAHRHAHDSPWSSRVQFNRLYIQSPTLAAFL